MATQISKSSFVSTAISGDIEIPTHQYEKGIDSIYKSLWIRTPLHNAAVFDKMYLILLFIIILLSVSSKVEARISGLFVGIDQGRFHKGDESAYNLYNTFSNNVSNFVGGEYLLGSSDDPVTFEDIWDKIDNMEYGPWDLGPDDTFIWYFCAHGGSYTSGSETTISSGDEVITLGSATGYDVITDDELTAMLHDVPNTNNWVILASCHSGGFWGDGSLQSEGGDWGDLEILPTTALLASAHEDTDSYSNLNGESVFTNAIIDGLSHTIWTDRLNADNDGDGVSLDELYDWVNTYPILNDLWYDVVYENGFGDPAIFTPDLWTPNLHVSLGFQGENLMEPNPIPVPSSVLLVMIGLSSLRFSRRIYKGSTP